MIDSRILQEYDHPNFEYKMAQNGCHGSGCESVGGMAYTDLITSKYKPGDPGFVEFFREREDFYASLAREEFKV